MATSNIWLPALERSFLAFSTKQPMRKQSILPELAVPSPCWKAMGRLNVWLPSPAEAVLNSVFEA